MSSDFSKYLLLKELSNAETKLNFYKEHPYYKDEVKQKTHIAFLEQRVNDIKVKIENLKNK